MNTNIKTKFSIWLLLALAIPPFMVGVDLMIMGVAIEPLAKSLNVGISLLQWLLAGYAIGNASFYVIAGKLSDMFGAKKIVNIGLVGFAVFSIGIALSYNVYFIIVFRLLQGAFGSFIITGALTWISKSFPPEERGMPTSAIVAGTGLGLSCGPVIGGALIHFFSWRMAFWVNVPFAILGIIFVSILMKRRKSGETNIHYDFVGLILVVASMVCFTIFISQGDNWGWLSHQTMIVFVVSLLLFIVLFVSEALIKNSLLDYAIFRVPQFFAGGFLAFLSYFVLIAWLFLFGIYLQAVYGFSPLEAGLAFLPYSVVFFLTALILMRVANRLPPKITIIVAFFLMSLSTLSLAFVHQYTPYWYITIGFALMGIGFTITTTLLAPVTMRHIAKSKAGLANGKMMMMRWLGSSLGAAIIATVFEQASFRFFRDSLSQYPLLNSANMKVRLLHDLMGSLPDSEIKKRFSGQVYTAVHDLFGHAYSHGLRVSMWVLFGVSVAALLLSLVLLESRAHAEARLKARE